jgi:alginate O-acetyltransferase complex protein AlgI
MVIAGMWHGSDNFNFLIWGVMHALALAIAKFWRESTLPPVPHLISRISTLVFVCMAWVVFRAVDVDSAWSLYKGQLGLQGWHLSETLRVTLQFSHVFAIFLGIACVIAPALTHCVRSRTPTGLLNIADVWPVFGFVFAFALVASRKAVPFLYFQF